MSLQVKDQDGDLSNVSTLSVSLVNVFQVIAFQTNPSGFDATFNRSPVLADLNLYDGLDVALDVPDVILHAVGANADVHGSLVFNATTNTLSFVKTGGILAPDTYNVSLRSSLSGFHDAAGRLLDGNGDLNDTQANDNFLTSFSVASSPARVVSMKDFARGPGQVVDENPLVANSHLAVSIDNASGVRSVAFNVQYNPALLHVTAAALASGLPGDWTIAVDNTRAGVAGGHRLGHDATFRRQSAAGARYRRRAGHGPLRGLGGVAHRQPDGEYSVGRTRPCRRRPPATSRCTRTPTWGMSTATACTPASTPG